MPNLANSNRIISMPSLGSCSAAMCFEMQPIVNVVSCEAAGFELLYRGTHAPSWADVDRTVIAFLRGTNERLPTLYVNLANESLLAIAASELVEAARRHHLIFEISEMHSESASVTQIASKVNLLIDQGLQFAIDDFGAGRDGLERLYSLTKVKAVKIDGAFLKNAMRRADAAVALRSLVSQWKKSRICVVAECVESWELLEFARDLDVDCVQGWHIDALLKTRLTAA